MKMSEVLTGPEAWVQGFAHLVAPDGRDRYCLLGALAKVTEQSPFRAGETEIARLRRIVGPNIIEFNDAPGRRWEEIAEVVAAYDADRLLHP